MVVRALQASLVLSITAGSGRFPAVNSQSIYVPFGLVNSKKETKKMGFLELLGFLGSDFFPFLVFLVWFS